MAASWLVVAVAALVGTAAGQPATRVGTAQAERAPLIETVALTGTLTSPHSSRLASEASGRVDTIAVEAGERVSQGQRLVGLDTDLAELDLAQAKARVREAEANLADARRRLAEARNLAERQSVAASEVEDRAAEVRRQEAVLARRRAERDHRQAMVERHTLTAPFDGVISERMVDIGEWVGPDTAIMELVAVERLRLELAVPQAYFGRIRKGTPVRVDVDALADDSLDADVSEVVPVARTDSRTFRVRVQLDNSGGRLAPGMSARGRLRLRTGEQGVVVPRDALIRYPDGRVTVWRIEANGDERTATEQLVRTGLGFDNRVAIEEGIDAGTTVVVQGNEALEEGQTVRVADE
jgi:RND family efflux transporter MFP subunit